MLELDAGDLLVGVLDGGERPAGLADLPSVGRYGQLEIESLLALEPDLVLLWPDSVGAAGREQLRRTPSHSCRWSRANSTNSPGCSPKSASG